MWEGSHFDFWPDSEDSCLTWFQTWQCLFKELWYSLLIQSQIPVDYQWDLESKAASSHIPECSVPIRSLKVSRVGTGHSSDEWPQVLWTAPDSRILSAFLGVITELTSHTVLLTIDALFWKRPRGYILIAGGTQRGGANSDALAKFQFRDVGLLLAILIGNVHRFPFSLLISVQACTSLFLCPGPKSLKMLVCIVWAKFIPFPNAQELRIECIWCIWRIHQSSPVFGG